MSIDQQAINEFFDAYEAARKAFEDEDNIGFNEDAWGDAQATMFEAVEHKGAVGVDVDDATIAYLLVLAMSRGHDDSRPLTWLLDVLPHLLVRLKLEESNEQ